MKKIIRFAKSIVMMYNRVKFYLRGNKIENNVEIGPHTHLKGCKIGQYCYIGKFGIINNTMIGPYTSIAPGVQIGGMEHSLWYLSTNTHLSDQCIRDGITHIGPDAWIAAGCIIKQGITIGQGVVIGANSFVNCDIPPYAIAVGTPAKVIKYRFSQEIIDKLIESQYWELSPKKAKKVLSQIEPK